MSRRARPSGLSGLSPLRRGQLLGLPLSGLLMGPLVALAYIRWLGGPASLMLGAALSVVLTSLGGWMVYRSDYAARHAVAGAALFVLSIVPLLGGASVMAASMAGQPTLAVPALCLAAATVLLPLLGVAWRTRARLLAQGEQGAWVRQNLDLVVGVMRADALRPHTDDRVGIKPWLVGALSVQLVWLFRVQGGSELQLLHGAVALLAVGTVWAAVASGGPALGKAAFMLQLEGRSGQRLRHEYWPDVQALRRSFWLSRWLMEKTDKPPIDAR